MRDSLSKPLSFFVIFYPIYKFFIHVLDIRSHTSLCKSKGHKYIILVIIVYNFYLSRAKRNRVT